MLKTVGFPSIRNGDQTILDGDLVIGTAGKGVDFSANANAPGMTGEKLTWYEEGTWTPANVSMAVISGVWAANGTYTRIGNIVYWTVNQTSGTVSANSTQALVSGLPFTPAAQSPGTITNSGASIGGVVVVETNNYVYSGLTFASQTALRISGFYQV